MISAYVPIAIFVVVATGFALFTIAFSSLLHPQKYNKVKLEPYECGIEPVTGARDRYSIRYYLVAMLFVIFDVETVFMFPWAVIFDKLLLFGLIEMLIFIFILVVGYYYAWQNPPAPPDPHEPSSGETAAPITPGAASPAPAAAAPPAASSPATPETPAALKAVPAPKPAAPKPAAATAAAPASKAAAHEPPKAAPPAGPPDPPPPADVAAPAFITSLQAAIPGSVAQVSYYLGDWTIIVPVGQLIAAATYLRDAPDALFDYCSDVTATDWPQRAERFDVLYLLYSIRHRHRVRVKVKVAEQQPIPSVTGIWPSANWLERETFDMFGVNFTGHPDRRRILMPEDWQGFPQRKDYPLEGPGELLMENPLDWLKLRQAREEAEFE